MGELLLQVFYFLRPVMFAHVPTRVFGLSAFELSTFLLLAILFAAYILSRAGKKRPFDRLDTLMLCFSSWCAVVTAIQWEISDWKWSLRIALPFVIYIVLRRLVVSPGDYIRQMRSLVFGFAIIVLVNAIFIFTGRGLFGVNWFTGFERYQGVFHDLHTMAHVVTFFIMLAVIYFGVVRITYHRSALRQTRVTALIILSMLPLALYSLYKGNVRTVFIGLVMFIGVHLVLTNRKRFGLFVAAVIMAWFTSNYVQQNFWDVTAGADPLGGRRAEMAGSGRPWIWRHNLELFADLPIEQKIIGIGVGNEIGVIGANGVITSEFRNRAWESHNDFLSALMELGIVGFLLLLAVYWTLLQQILRLPMEWRVLYLPMFVSVMVMNFLSNSYLSRFGLGQLFAMVMIGIHVAPISRRSFPIAAVWRPDPMGRRAGGG